MKLSWLLRLKVPAVCLGFTAVFQLSGITGVDTFTSENAHSKLRFDYIHSEGCFTDAKFAVDFGTKV